MISKRIEQLKNSLLSLFLKSNCPLCNRPAETEVCQYCQRQLQRCKLSDHSKLWQGELPVFIWGNYGHGLKRAIAALKYDNQPQLARPLGFWLAEAWLKSPVAKNTPNLTVVPIPLHHRKQKSRGFNQAELIAANFCQITGYQHQPFGLERIRETDAQFSLSPKERSQNLAEAFTIGKSFRQKPPTSPVLIVDDIYTTGATVISATKTLHQKGIQVYGVVALASSHK